jgi:hypothetical protein
MASGNLVASSSCSILLFALGYETKGQTKGTASFLRWRPSAATSFETGQMKNPFLQTPNKFPRGDTFGTRLVYHAV